MLNIFLALWLAFACPAQNHSSGNMDTTVTVTANDVGGDNGHPPPPPPPPPPVG